MSGFDPEEILSAAKAIAEDVVVLRRRLHQCPELQYELHKTSAIVCEELERLGIAFESGVAETGAAFADKLTAATGAKVRGRGLMLGLEVGAGRGPEMMLAALRDGIVLLADGPDGEILSFTPPFEISEGEMDFVAARVQEYFTSLPGSSS